MHASEIPFPSRFCTHLALNVNYLSVKFAKQSVVKAACLLHTLFLLTNKLGRH